MASAAISPQDIIVEAPVAKPKHKAPPVIPSRCKAPPVLEHQMPPHYKAPPVCLPKAMPASLSPGHCGGISNDMNARKSYDDRLTLEPTFTDKSYAHRWELPPVVEERIRSSLLMHETTASNVSTVPSYARDLGAQSKHLARRVIWDTDRDLIISDDIIYGSAMLQNMRTNVPPDVLNIKVQHFKRSMFRFHRVRL